jgi:hypothetical protein
METKKKKHTLSARERIKPRGLWGCMKGRILYDDNKDIFNLDMPEGLQEEIQIKNQKSKKALR